MAQRSALCGASYRLAYLMQLRHKREAGISCMRSLRGK